METGNLHLKEELVAFDIDDAEEIFVVVKDRLLDILFWRDQGFAGTGLSLVDAHMQELLRPAHTGDRLLFADASLHLLVQSIEYDDFPDEELETFTLRLSRFPAESSLPGDALPMAAFVLERRARHLVIHLVAARAASLPPATEPWQQMLKAIMSGIAG